MTSDMIQRMMSHFVKWASITITAPVTLVVSGELFADIPRPLCPSCNWQLVTGHVWCWQ